MLSTLKNATCLVPLLLVTAVLLANPDCLPFGNIQANTTQASRSLSTAHKVSPLLKASKHHPEETVTVIVTLGATRSARLNGFLNRNGIRQRREMKNLASFSVTLPFRMVTVWMTKLSQPLNPFNEST